MTATIDGIKAKECVGCGFCCIKTPCWVALRVYGQGITECPALKWDTEKNRYICGVIDNAKGALKDRYIEELYIGEGCCAGLNDWRWDVKPRREQDGPVLEPIEISKDLQMFVRILAKQWISSDVWVLVTMAMTEHLIKDGKSEEYAEEFCKELIHMAFENRSSYVTNFMG